MNKIGIHRIGFVEQHEVIDQWQEQQEQQQEERLLPAVYLNGGHWFKSIDQSNTTLIENLISDDSGIYYEVQLPFVVRQVADIELAKKYQGRPVVVIVVAVDGSRYSIGTKSYPAYLTPSNRYDGINTREMAMEVNYRSKTSVLR